MAEHQHPQGAVDSEEMIGRGKADQGLTGRGGHLQHPFPADTEPGVPGLDLVFPQGKKNFRCFGDLVDGIVVRWQGFVEQLPFGRTFSTR